MNGSSVLRVRSMTALVVACLFLSVLPRIDEVAASEAACRHPYPCGDEWPAELANRRDFTLRDVTSVSIPSLGTDGVEVLLDGWLAMPDLPAGVKAPTLILSSPYLTCEGGCTSPNDPSWWGESPPYEATVDLFGVRPRNLIARGFALLFVSVRGTGRSSGCMELFGPNEQQDQVEIVKWASTRAWSNGRVAMGGLSYLSGTAWAGAVKAAEQGVEALKTTITSGLMSDLYTLFHSPQGSRDMWSTQIPALISRTTFTPPVSAAVSDLSAVLADPSEGPQPQGNWAGTFAERACPATLEWLLQTSQSYTGDRSEGFFEARRLIMDFPKVTAASLIAHGLRDYGHLFQDEGVWGAASLSPKWQVAGLWRHEFPNDEYVGPSSISETVWWTSSVLAWLDYWLKGVGSPPRLDVVDYQDSDGRWHDAKSWPPNVRDESLHLAPEGLVLDPQQGGESRFTSAVDPRSQEILFQSGPYPFSDLAGPLGLCTGPVEGLSAKFETPPVGKEMMLAGNPSVDLYLRSSQPGGIVSVDVAVLSQEFACTDGIPSGARWISHGSADLEFHSSRYSRTPFPVDEATRLRLDLSALHEQLEPTDRLAVVVSRGDFTYYSLVGPAYQPEITLLSGREGSRISMPIVKGTFSLMRDGTAQ